jgi:hypothetical protein
MHLLLSSSSWFIMFVLKSYMSSRSMMRFLSAAISAYKRWPVRLHYHLFCFAFTHGTYDSHISWCSCRSTETHQVSLVEEKLITLLEHLISPPIFNKIGVARILVSVFSRSLFVLLSVFAWSLYVCPSICGFWLPL